MDNIVALLRQKALSSHLPESVEGIDALIKITDEIADILLASIEVSSDRLITVDRISQAFDNYIKSLKSYLTKSENDMDFWAASLIVHHHVNDITAENILLNAVRHANIDKMSSAALILCRTKHPKVKDMISERLRDSNLSDKEKRFLREKLDW
jgi:hypothetical protein